jgi:hypothetical protein
MPLYGKVEAVEDLQHEVKTERRVRCLMTVQKGN